MSSKMLGRAARALVIVLFMSILLPGVSSAGTVPRAREGVFLKGVFPAGLEEALSWWEALRGVLRGTPARPAARTRPLAKEGIGIDPNGAPRPIAPPLASQTTSDGGR
jgi:hypothetical protein